jgi:tetratricopeptide (TPR) repeat protein
MAQKSDTPGNFWRELKRRKVGHVITVYAAVSFIILQVLDIKVQPLKLPAWTMQFVIILLCIGFIISVLVSWVYDLTPAGLEKTKPVNAAIQSDQKTSSTSGSLKTATFISAVIIISLLAFNFFGRININSGNSKIEKSVAGTANLTAYDFYKRGRDALPEFWIEVRDSGALNRAGMYYRKAIGFDSTFANAYVGLAEVYYANHFLSGRRRENYLDSTLILADRAIFYDKKLSEAHIVKGMYLFSNWLREEALNEVDSALKLKPDDWMTFYGKAYICQNDDNVEFLDNLQKALIINHNGKESPTIYRMIGKRLLETGFIDKAVSCFTKAFELDRDSAFYLGCLGLTESDQGKFQKSIGYCERALMTKPDYSEVIERKADDYLFSGQFQESLKYYKELNHIDQHSAYSYYQNKFNKEADRLFDQLVIARKMSITKFPRAMLNYYDLAEIYAFMGDKETALNYFRYCTQMKNIKNCQLWMLTHIKYDPLFNNIRDVPEFQKIVKEAEAKYNAEHEKVRKWLDEQGKL